MVTKKYNCTFEAVVMGSSELELTIDQVRRLMEAHGLGSCGDDEKLGWFDFSRPLCVKTTNVEEA